jgi:hypothetical protein
MTALDGRVSAVINTIDPEYRMTVIAALKASDGTVLSFQQELAAQVWDNPDLPVQDILDKIAFDVA